MRAAASLAAALALLLAGCGGATGPPPPPPGSIPAGQQIGTASIAGRVVYEGAPPARKTLKMTSEASCHKPGSPEALSEEVVVGGEGGLKNVWVRVVSGLGDRVFAAPKAPVEVDQAGCVFIPHAVTAQTGQMILFKNSDPVVHNVHAIAKENDTFNVSLSGKGRTTQRFFLKPEVVRIRCDLHVWMGGYVLVHSSPFQATTGDDGAFTIGGLPAGDYEVEAWHETLGTSRKTITLADGGSQELVFSFAPEVPR